MTAITVYTKPACVQCNATFRALDKAGVDYAKVDITVDSLIPRVSALIWMELFMFCSVFMCLLVSCENFLVLYLWWRADPTVQPTCTTPAERREYLRCSPP